VQANRVETPLCAEIQIKHVVRREQQLVRAVTLQQEQSKHEELPIEHKGKPQQISIEQQIEAVLHGMEHGSERSAAKQAEQHLDSVLASNSAKQTAELKSPRATLHPEAHVGKLMSTATVCDS
jgi:hypothetical protein